jgi:hypothetical protein
MHLIPTLIKLILVYQGCLFTLKGVALLIILIWHLYQDPYGFMYNNITV